MPLPFVDPAPQRIAILQQLAKPSAKSEIGSLPPLEVAPVAATEHKPGISPWSKLLYGAGLAADVGTTAYGAAKGTTAEANPLMKIAGPKMAAPLVAGTSIASALIAKKLLGDKHPKVLNAILAGMGGAHGAAALSNIHQMHLSSGPAPTAPDASASHGNLVQGPDGSWYDPNFLTVK